jgi:hypothetical protein
MVKRRSGENCFASVVGARTVSPLDWLSGFKPRINRQLADQPDNAPSARRLSLAQRMTAAVIALSVGLPPAAVAQAPLLNITPFSSETDPTPAPRLRRPVVLPKKASKLEELITRKDYEITFLPPLPLNGVKIGGLTAKSTKMLGDNFFVVVDNTKFNTMAEVYRENRLRSKSNYVTADSIIHPYLAFTNRVIADTVAKHIEPDLSAMLKAMLDVALKDYKQAEDAEVREDIEHNMAFLAVAVKLIDPKYFPPVPLRVVKMVQTDLDSIYSGKGSTSTIFERPEDFSTYQPLGWYNSTPQLQSFFRCREWITRMSYPFTDTSASQSGLRGNSFRRSALLYRALDLSKVQDRPAYEVWSRLYKSWPLLGAQLKDWGESTISPLEYKAQVKTAAGDLKVTLNALAEPFFRTKLLLAVRKQKPVKLGAASIFDLEEAGKNGPEEGVCFRLLPKAGDPEWPWLKACTTLWHGEDDTAASGWPLSLLILHAWGAPQADNTLLDNYTKLDPKLVKVLPSLEQLVMTKLPGGVVKPIEDRRWQILSGYFKTPTEGMQTVMRTEQWMTRLLESSFAGWVDSHISIAPESWSTADKPDKKPEGQGDNEAAAAETPSKSKVALFHYVQPSPEIFASIRQDALNLQERLTALNYLPDKFKERFSDFIRLSERLERMASLELKGQKLPLFDVKLLQNFDLVLERVDLPTEGILPLHTPTDPKSGQTVGTPNTGVTFGLGRPGQLFIILQDGTNWTLGRGAIYTYFEVPSATIKPETWRHKLDGDLVRPPYWAEKFDTVQDPLPLRNKPQVR